jgi:hypothetical protein
MAANTKTPMFDWARVRFVANGTALWSQDSAIELIERVEEIVRVERARGTPVVYPFRPRLV